MALAAALSVDNAELRRWSDELGPSSSYAQNRRAALARNSTNDFLRDQSDMTHVVVAPDASTASEESDMASRTSNVRGFHASSVRTFQSSDDRNALIDQMGQDDLAIAVCNALKDAFGQSNASVKRLATVANCNERAARNWIEGRNPPTLLYALRIMAHVPEFQAECRRLASMESSLDPNFERAMSEAMGLFQQIQGEGPVKKAVKITRLHGDVPNHRGNTAALRRLERRQRGIVNAPEAINAKQLEGKTGWRFHPTNGWKRDRFYRTGDPSRPSQMEMVSAFYDTIRRAQA